MEHSGRYEFFNVNLRHHRQRTGVSRIEKASFGSRLTALYLGISAASTSDESITLALAVRDSVYLIDYSVQHVDLAAAKGSGPDGIADYIIKAIEAYEHSDSVKFIGAGVWSGLACLSSTLCSRLWLELDILPIVIGGGYEDCDGRKGFWATKPVDEQADSLARKCIMYFGPSQTPLLQIGWQGLVQVDAGFRAQLVQAQDYRSKCTQASWEAMLVYATRLQNSKTKVAFFSSTPQGGGVALMRHSLVRFSRAIGVDVGWYVPKPRPRVFRITKNVHNLLQGVGQQTECAVSDIEWAMVIQWVAENASRYWFADKGPLCPPDQGGADVVVVDDPQMAGLIPLIKAATPNRRVIYRSHIQIRTDLVALPGSAQSKIWDLLWASIQHCDLFVAHPVPSFVPRNVPRDKVLYMPATSDFLDGLNKHMNTWDTKYYSHMYNTQCHLQRMTELHWPERKYIIQVARFDPSKGIPTVIDSYAEFRRQLDERGISDSPPQLVLCGNGSVDDPDGSDIFHQVMTKIETQCPHLLQDISVMRLDPYDQVLNYLIANAYVVLQLSTSEGFEVKVSEALRKGRPVIGTHVGGIALQIQHGVNGYLVQPNDPEAVANHLVDLFTDYGLYCKLSEAASASVTDHISTVGNAAAWYYLVSKCLDSADQLPGRERWVSDILREEAGNPDDKSNSN